MATDEDASVASSDELVNLRNQAESGAKEGTSTHSNRLAPRHFTREICCATDRLYAKRHPAWISWDDVQTTRKNAMHAWVQLKASNATPVAKAKMLNDLLVILLHSIQPPDRVGVIRRLRVGHTLIKDKDGFAIDLTKFRHKVTLHSLLEWPICQLTVAAVAHALQTSKFFGPSITSVSKLIVPFITEYLSMMAFEIGAESLCTPLISHRSECHP